MSILFRLHHNMFDWIRRRPMHYLDILLYRQSSLIKIVIFEFNPSDLTSGNWKFLLSLAAVRAIWSLGNKLQSAKVILFESRKCLASVSSSSFVFKKASNFDKLWMNRCWRARNNNKTRFNYKKQLTWKVWMIGCTFNPGREFLKNIISSQRWFWMQRCQFRVPLMWFKQSC